MVAPPISSGRSSSRRAISLATCDHLVERGRDEPRAPDDVAAFLDGAVQQDVGRDHHAQVDHLVVVAAEDHAHDVLPDVVDVALHGAEDHLALGAGAPAGGDQRLLLVLHERLQVRDRLLHRPGALHDLRQEHLPRAEQVADDLHPGHQRSLDHVERALVALPGLLGVLHDEPIDPVHQRVGQALLHGALAPGEVLLLRERLAGDRLREPHEPLGRVGAAVEDDVLDVLEEVLRDVLVDVELAGVHDRHVQAGGDRVVQERRVHRAADRLVPTERERQVRHAAGDLRAGAVALDLARRLDEGLRELVVLLDPGADRQDVRVDDHVLGREPGALGEEPEGPLGDLDLALDRAGLALLVEAHHDDGGAVAVAGRGLAEEVLLALLEADRVDDGLALDALESGLAGPPTSRSRS